MDRAVIIATNLVGRYIGGSAKNAMELASALQRIGWRVHIVAGYVGSATDSGLDYRVIGDGHEKHIMNGVSAGRALVAMDRDADVIHSNGCFGFNYLAGDERKPFISHLRASTLRLMKATLRDPAFRPSPSALRFLLGNIPIYAIEGYALPRSNFVLANTEPTRQAIIHDYFFPEEKIGVLLNGCERGEDDGKPVEREGSRGRKLRLLTVLRLTYTKGIDRLLRAFRIVLSLREATELVIVGDGRLRKYLRRRVEDLNLSGHVRTLGELQGTALQEAYKEADLFVYASSPGVTLAEAMSYGLPFVLTYAEDDNTSGTPIELIERAGLGHISHLGSAEVLARDVIAAIDDPEWRAKQSDLCREFVRANLDWDMIARAAARYYEKAIASSS